MSGANLLIISDLHLGEDIKPASKTGYLRHALLLERELENFLRHYTTHRMGDRPWRLIVNGDMVDFLGICLLPPDGEVAPGDVVEEDRVYGLGTRPQAARAKMLRVLDRHRGVFRALAGFVGAGNRLDIVVGNHDAEFHWPIVQETFKQGVAGLHEGPRAREEIEAAITFHPWFYFEENVAWVEHGHQYDDYCSFDYILSPTSPDGEILPTLGHAGMRYVGNLAGYVEGQETWGFWQYVRWSFAKGWKGVVQIARGFLLMVLKMLAVWKLCARNREAGRARRRQHLERLRQLATQFRLGEDTLVAIDALRRQPVPTNLARLVMALMLDRLAILVTTTVLVLVFVVALPWTWALGAVACALAAASLLARVLERARGDVDPSARLKEAPERIRRFVRAPFVVFGHTHDPIALPLEDGGWYLNTGTWVPADARDPGPRSFTHVVIRREGNGLRAALCQWRDGQSREFTSVET